MMGPKVRKMMPRRERDLPEWEVSIDGSVVGWIRQHKIGRAISTFYNATAIYPPTGQLVNLENSIDFDERLAVIVAFVEDPERFRGVHFR
jgi:hypothetical protein